MDANDEARLRADIGRRFALIHRDAALRRPEARSCERVLRTARPSDHPEAESFGCDSLRFWRSLSSDPRNRWLTPTMVVSNKLALPWRQLTAACNDIHRRLRITDNEMLATSPSVSNSCRIEAAEHAEAYHNLQRCLAGPAIQAARHFETLAGAASALAQTRWTQHGWHTSAAGLWLRLEHLAAYAYPLMPDFGMTLWHALHFAELPRWPTAPFAQAVRPILLPDIALELPPSLVVHNNLGPDGSVMSPGIAANRPGGRQEERPLVAERAVVASIEA